VTAALESPPIVDTHTHLDDDAFDLDRDVVIEASRAVGVRHFINIGYAPDRWETSRALRDGHPDIDFALGLHPQLAGEFGHSLARELKQSIDALAPVAVGEIGFDFSRAAPSFETQERAFRGQLEIASTEGLPTIVHQRDASDALMTELDRWSDLAPIVLHSFDGTRRLADWAHERGCFIGIGGLATRRSSAPLREVLARVPVDRLLLETDSPYLAPPGAASRRNAPVNLPRIADVLAPLWNLSGDELCCLTTSNAVKLFRLPPIESPSRITGEGPHSDSPAARGELESWEGSRDSGAAST
jgi:TatD DNase family protein